MAELLVELSSSVSDTNSDKSIEKVLIVDDRAERHMKLYYYSGFRYIYSSVFPSGDTLRKKVKVRLQN